MTLKYRTIVADPPWPYKNKRTGGSLKSGSAQHYDTLSLEAIGTLPVAEIAARDSVLFLWSTAPLLREALQTMDAWGFDYKGRITWVKLDCEGHGRMGMGYWYRVSEELCLMGVRGLPKAYRAQVPNIIFEKPTQHSVKPAGFWAKVEPYAQKPWIELFCKGRSRMGWDGWGNQCEGGVDLGPDWTR